MHTMVTSVVAAGFLLSNMPAHSRAFDDNVLPPETAEALERFYLDFDGDNWINNEGWLDPDIDPCDWHGVICRFNLEGQYGVWGLYLGGNKLSGYITDSDIFEHVTSVIDMSNNALTGTLDVLPLELHYLDLSGNQLTGELPPVNLDITKNLDGILLARNGFSGEIPPSWQGLTVSWLDLSDNQLEGSLEPAFAAIGGEADSKFVSLAGNRFSGLVPASITSAPLSLHNESNQGGGVNLCWNDLEVDNTTHDWLAERHVGGPNFEQCLQRERTAIDIDVSGSWFDPTRNGEGVVQQLLPDGRVVHYTFGFDVLGRQHWLTGLGTASEYALHWGWLQSTRGQFSEGRVDGRRAVGGGSEWRMDRKDANAFQLQRSYYDYHRCPDWPDPFPCFGPPSSDRLNYTRLTEIAGTHCHNSHPLQWISGTWYDPESDGEGFVVEITPDGQGVVYWFSYRGDDSYQQAWMTGLGEFEGQRLHVAEVVMPAGGAWGEAFDSTAVELRPWGSLTIEFIDDNQAVASWDSDLSEFGSGSYSLIRLSGVKLAECEATPQQRE